MDNKEKAARNKNKKKLNKDKKSSKRPATAARHYGQTEHHSEKIGLYSVMKINTTGIDLSFR